MTGRAVDARFVFRSQSMIPLLTIAHGAGLWAREGIDIKDFHLTDDPVGAEEDLFAGRIDWIFGNHISPYMRIAQGHPIVCLAQTENWWETHVATRPEIADLPQLNGKRIATAPLLTDGKFCGHASGNRILVLELNGVDPAKVRYVTEKGSKTELVRTGKADACFVAPERSEEAIAAGLRIHRLAPLAMVHSVTFTSTVPRIAREDGLAGRVIRVLLAATHFLKTRKDETVELWRKPVASFRPGQYERLVASYEDMVHEYESTLYPRAESILNAHRLASMVYPGATDANPMCLWDLRPLHEVHRSGFLRSLGEPVLAGSA